VKEAKSVLLLLPLKVNLPNLGSLTTLGWLVGLKWRRATGC
jgi:hypothetical protein